MTYPGARLDFVQQLAKEVFGSIAAVDLFSNEDDIARAYEQAVLICGQKVNNFPSSEIQLQDDQVTVLEEARAGSTVTTTYTGTTTWGTFIVTDPGHILYDSTDTSDVRLGTKHTIENEPIEFSGVLARKRFGYGAQFKVIFGNPMDSAFDTTQDSNGDPNKAIPIYCEPIGHGAGYKEGDVIIINADDSAFDSYIRRGSYTVDGTYIPEDHFPDTTVTKFNGTLKIMITHTTLPYINGNIIGIYNKRDKGNTARDIQTNNNFPNNIFGTDQPADFSFPSNGSVIQKPEDSDNTMNLSDTNLNGAELLKVIGITAGEGHALTVEEDYDTNESILPIYYNNFSPENLENLVQYVNTQSILSSEFMQVQANNIGFDSNDAQSFDNAYNYLYGKYSYNVRGGITRGKFIVADEGDSTRSSKGAVFEIEFDSFQTTDSNENFANYVSEATINAGKNDTNTYPNAWEFNGLPDWRTYIKSIVVKSPGTNYVVGDKIVFPGTRFILAIDNPSYSNPGGRQSSVASGGSLGNVDTGEDVTIIIGALTLPWVNLVNTAGSINNTDVTLTNTAGSKGAQDVLSGLLSQVPERFDFASYCTYDGSTTSGTFNNVIQTSTGEHDSSQYTGASSTAAKDGDVKAIFSVTFARKDGSPTIGRVANVNVEKGGYGYQAGDVIHLIGADQNPPFNGIVTIKLHAWLLNLVNAPFTGALRWLYNDTSDTSKGIGKYKDWTFDLDQINCQLIPANVSDEDSDADIQNAIINGSVNPDAINLQVGVKIREGEITLEQSRRGSKWNAADSYSYHWLVIKGSQIKSTKDPTKPIGPNVRTVENTTTGGGGISTGIFTENDTPPDGVDGDDDIIYLVKPNDFNFFNGVNNDPMPLIPGDKLQMIFTILSHKDQTDASGDLIAIARTALVELVLIDNDPVYLTADRPKGTGWIDYDDGTNIGVNFIADTAPPLEQPDLE